MRAIKDVSPVAAVSLNKLGIITENKETGERKRNSIGIMQNIRRFPLRRSMRERLEVFAEARTLAKEALIHESNPVDEPRQRRHRGPISRRRGLPNRFSIVRLAAGTRSGENVHASLTAGTPNRVRDEWRKNMDGRRDVHATIVRYTRMPIDNDDSETRGKERGASRSA